LWSYITKRIRRAAGVVLTNFAYSGAGVHAREVSWEPVRKLVCDDYSGYKALFERGVIEIGCMAQRSPKTP